MARVPLEERRQQFIAAARTVIAEHGIEGATTRRIADAAGAPLATLHYCFDSKESLLWTMWETHLRSLGSDDVPSVAAGSGLGHAASHALRHSLERLVVDEELAVTTTELLLWARRQDLNLGQQAFGMYFEASVDYLRRHLEPGDPDAVVQPLARLISAAYDGLMLQWITFHDRAQLDESVEMWAKAFELLVEHQRSAAGATT